jgi:hypothetical protein
MDQPLLEERDWIARGILCNAASWRTSSSLGQILAAVASQVSDLERTSGAAMILAGSPLATLAGPGRHPRTSAGSPVQDSVVGWA